jgi:hypothetical protein
MEWLILFAIIAIHAAAAANSDCDASGWAS